VSVPASSIVFLSTHGVGHGLQSSNAKTFKYIQEILSLAQYECAIVVALKQHAQVLLHGASVRAYKESRNDVLELSHILNARTAYYQIVDVDHDDAVVVCEKARCWGLDDFDGIEHLFQVQIPAERGLIQPIQCFVELHDLGPESISQNIWWTLIHDFFQWGTHERVRDVQAVQDTVLTGSDAEDDTNDSGIGDGCVRLIEVEAMYLSISASNKSSLVLDDRTSRVSLCFQDQM
jgi:hypothetical protein